MRAFGNTLGTSEFGPRSTFLPRTTDHLLTYTTRCRTHTTRRRILRKSGKESLVLSQPLANAELAVMDLLWQQDRLTAREIREQLYPDASKAQHGTVQRLLQRLEDKGFVQRDRSLAIHFFSPLVSRQTYAGQQLESLADKLTAGSFAPLITHLVEQKKISADELARIRDILGTPRKKKGGKR